MDFILIQLITVSHAPLNAIRVQDQQELHALIVRLVIIWSWERIGVRIHVRLINIPMILQGNVMPVRQRVPHVKTVQTNVQVVTLQLL